MTDPPPVSLSKGDPADDLARARDLVLASIAGTGGSLQGPTLQGAAPLRALPPVVEAKLALRVAAGLSPAGTEHPRAAVWQRTVLPAGFFALLDALGFVIAVITGHTVLAVFTGVLFVVFAGLSLAAARFAASDPLRLTVSDLRAITSASHWESDQVWAGPLGYCQERSLVVAATYAAERVVRCPAWLSGRLDEHRVRLDLVEELDQIDAQAFRIASGRYLGHPGSSVGGLPVAGPPSPVLDEAWETLLTRVAALTCYADSLDGLAHAQAAAIAGQGDPVRDSAIMAGSVQDEIAVDDLFALTYFFGAVLHAGGGGP